MRSNCQWRRGRRDLLKCVIQGQESFAVGQSVPLLDGTHFLGEENSDSESATMSGNTCLFFH